MVEGSRLDPRRAMDGVKRYLLERTVRPLILRAKNPLKDVFSPELLEDWVKSLQTSVRQCLKALGKREISPDGFCQDQAEVLSRQAHDIISAHGGREEDYDAFKAAREAVQRRLKADSRAVQHVIMNPEFTTRGEFPTIALISAACHTRELRDFVWRAFSGVLCEESDDVAVKNSVKREFRRWLRSRGIMISQDEEAGLIAKRFEAVPLDTPIPAEMFLDGRLVPNIPKLWLKFAQLKRTHGIESSAPFSVETINLKPDEREQWPASWGEAYVLRHAEN